MRGLGALPETLPAEQASLYSTPPSALIRSPLPLPLLLQREYLERDETNSTLYKYLA
jgi:hypothetical protein